MRSAELQLLLLCASALFLCPARWLVTALQGGTTLDGGWPGLRERSVFWMEDGGLEPHGGGGPGWIKCGKMKTDECDFSFGFGHAPGKPRIPHVLSAKNNYQSPPLKHVKGDAMYAVIYINSSDGAPCTTKASKSSCGLFTITGGSKRPGPVQSSPQLTLQRKDAAAIKAVRGHCYGLYFGEFVIKVGSGPQGRKYIKWKDGNRYYPKKRRCLVFQVA